MPRPPFHVHDFIGQRKNVDPLLRQQDGASARGEPLSHTLLIGPSGLGKSLLARTLAQRGGTACTRFLGDVPAAEVAAGLARLRPCDLAFFDEAHNLEGEVQELLFEVIDTGSIPAKFAPGATAGCPAEVPPITLVLATDRPGKLLNALHKRIPVSVQLQPYPEDELKEIVERVASSYGVLLSSQAARALARVCNGLPRRAEHFVRKLRHHVPDSEQRQLGVSDVERFLAAWGIDADGLGKLEKRYLRFVRRNGSASLETLASHLGSDVDFVKGQIEQVLRYRGLIAIKSTGRVLTRQGKALVKAWRDARKARQATKEE